MYAARIEAARERKAYLATLHPVARELGPAAVAGLRRAIEGHELYAQQMARRRFVFADSRSRVRTLRVTRHILRGDYRPRSCGGLGFLSLARDLAVALGTNELGPLRNERS
jgi:hypothetical protein